MRLTSADINKDGVESLYTFTDEDASRAYEVKVEYENVIPKEIKINYFPYANKQDELLNLMGSSTVYIANDKMSYVFASIFQHIVTHHDIAAAIRNVNYPGKTLLLIDYGTLSINREEIGKISEAIIKGILEKVTKELEVEEKAEEVAEVNQLEGVDDSSEYPIPFSTNTDGFIEDDFDIGEVEYDD